MQGEYSPEIRTIAGKMAPGGDNRRRRPAPYGIITLWSIYVLMFSGGLYLLARECAAIKQAAAYANASLLWDVSQLQGELLRLGLLVERTQAAVNPASPQAIATQLDLAWGPLDRLEQGLSHVWIRAHPTLAASVAELRGLLTHLAMLFQRFTAEPLASTAQVLSQVTAAHTLAQHIMSGVHQQHDAETTLLHAALRSFRLHLVGYAVGLTLLIALLTYMTWRHLRSEQARRESERGFREMLQQAHDALERRVEERTAALITANASLQCESAERQRAAREMLEISTREQRRIGQDLHDGLGQLLTGMALLSQALTQKLAAKSMAEATDASQLVQLANQAMAWARELVRGLSPIEMQGAGLLPALQDLATQTEHLFGITCQVTCDRPPAMPDHTVATHLYRIAQEAVSNAVKHGLARHVVLALTTEPHRVTLTVQDDGIGFSDVSEKPSGMGLRIMHYRAGMIGAALTIQRDASGGARVVCVWPHSLVRTAC